MVMSHPSHFSIPTINLYNPYINITMSIEPDYAADEESRDIIEKKVEAWNE
jgi:hypothetical protein